MRKFKTQHLTIIALAIALNYVGANIALFLHLPLYLDSIGTILAGTLFGPIGGVLTAAGSGLISGITTDLFALYYLPVGLLTGCLSGWLLYQHPHSKRMLPIVTLGVALPGTIVSSLITNYLFHGVTSSGSSLIVQILSGLGLNQLVSITIVQAGTDYLDRLLTIVVITQVCQHLKKQMTTL
ncbi:ECF transporter S component [Latilactobacillus graminis]|uniref:Membrane protein n=2 Tax=Latilactobacillus graminis TaxID=60519 RepID=A0AA89I0P2_9LACO|nr:ECF transporter S component [Latilactobacillus graminis]KRM22305.1 membrane protein [Latilactobacillus graminis DSM 20719]QFP79520.1 ECF transporter S component [Latilactobacillus graminis]